MPIVRAAVVQAAPVGFDLEPTLERVRVLTAEAAAQGARLVVLPEAFVGGYPRGFDFGATIGSRTAEGREWFRRYHAGAIDVPGPAVDALGGAARAAEVVLVVGVIERDQGTLYCTALTLGPDGRLLGKHRKLMPTAAERLIWGFGDGSTLAAVPTPIGRVGCVICWENYMPLLRMHMYAQNVDFYCAPTADARDSWQATMRHIALEGRCFVLGANQFCRRADYPADYPGHFDTTAEPNPVVCRGGSVIVGPLGDVLAGPLFDAPGILTADLDLDDRARSRFDFDPVGHYARPDIFRLMVDDRPRPPVVTASSRPTPVSSTPSTPPPQEPRP
ncbi:MAG: nitrilase-related carbon-nitrogen hydrolase [Isosphaeraceae bacterium]